MNTGTYTKYFKEVKEIEDKKANLLWNLIMVEQYLEESQDDNACKVLLEISRDIEDIVRILKIDRDIPRIHEVAEELKTINEFTQQFEKLIRGRSWFSICRAFDPKSSLDTIKDLGKILKKSTKSPKGRRAVKKEEGGLIDDEMIDEYNNRKRAINDKIYGTDQEIKDNLKSLKMRSDFWKMKNEMESILNEKHLDLKNL